MKIKVMIVDGIIESVLANEEASNANIDVEIIDFDKNIGNKELLDEQYEEKGLKNISFNINHCENEEEME